MDIEEIILDVIVGIIVIVIFIVRYALIFWVIKTIIRAIKSRANKKYVDNTLVNTRKNYNDIDNQLLKKYNLDNINQLKVKLFEIFTQFEEAYNNLDYVTMKYYATSSFYSNFQTGLSLNAEKGIKKVITNINRQEVKIYFAHQTEEEDIINTKIKIDYISYTTDSTGKLISGSKTVPITESFEVDFVKPITDVNQKNCPNCGAVIEDFICKYCNTQIENKGFKISAIKKII